MTLTEARENVGAAVVYHARYFDSPAEVGVITSVSDTYVFVRFPDSEYLGGQATNADSLELFR